MMTEQQKREWRKAQDKREASYREQTRRTMQRFSDQALRFQDSIIIGGIDREECDREIMRRMGRR